MGEPYREILSLRFEVRTELARSVRKKRGLSISRYGTSNPVNKYFIKWQNENIPNINRQFSEQNIFTKLVQNHFSQGFLLILKFSENCPITHREFFEK